MRITERTVNTIFRYAEKVTGELEGEKWTFRAFIEPRIYDIPRNDDVLPEGIYDGRSYLMLASFGAFVGTEKGAKVKSSSGIYEIMRLERLPSGHWECIMRRKAGT